MGSVNLLPLPKIKAKLNIEEGGELHKVFTQTCYDHMEKYTPVGSGYLHAFTEVTAGKISYFSPYAHYQYVGRVYVMPEFDLAGFYNEQNDRWFSIRGQKKIPRSDDSPRSVSLKYNSSTATNYWDAKMWVTEKDDIYKEMQEYIDKNIKEVRI